MRKNLIILLAVCCLTVACTKEVTITRYQGIIMEQSQRQVLEGVLTMLTDGTTVYDSIRTAANGKFFLTANWNIMGDNCYLFIDGEGRYPSKKVELTGTKQANFDFFYLYLFDEQTLGASPSVNENVTIEYVNQAIVFSDIVIYSPYTLVETSIIMKGKDGTTNRYPLVFDGTKYSAVIEGLTIGEWYQWAIYAANEIANTTTNTQNLLYGFQNITIRPITQATTNSVVVSCSINGVSPYPTQEVGFCWGTSPNPNMGSSVTSSIANNVFTAQVSNLNFRVTTYIWAYIRNQNGIAYSEPVVLPANNPLNFFEFEYNNYTYTVYEFHQQMNWYQAVDACQNLSVCFDDWTLPNYMEVAAYVSAYIREFQVLPYNTIWSCRREMWLEEGESETHLSTPNGLIMENKQNQHWVVAVRKY